MPSSVLASMMRRAVTDLGNYSHPGVVKWEEAPVPAPVKNQVLIQVKAVALNPIDHKIGEGALGFSAPVYPCSDVAGTVVGMGPEASSKLAVGTDVCCNLGVAHGGGGLAEYVAIEENKVGHIPSGWSYTKAASLPMTAMTAEQCVKSAGPLTAKSQVVVLGASGGVGSLVLQLLRQSDATLFAVASGARGAFVQAIGGPKCEVIDYKKEDWAAKFAKAAAPPTAVIDASAAPPHDSYYKASKLGMGSGSFVTTNALDPSFRNGFWTKYVEKYWGWKTGLAHKWAIRPSYTQVGYLRGMQTAGALIDYCGQLAAKGELKMPEVTVFQPTQLHEAFGMMMAGKGGKAVIDMSAGVAPTTGGG